MSASQIGAIANPANYLTPYQFGQSQGARYANTGTAPVRNVAPSQNANFGGDQVSLSDAARALSAQNGRQGAAQNAAGGNVQPGSSDFSQEAQLLGGLTDKAFAAMGVISAADEATTKVSFDALSYQVSSSVSASQSQQGGQINSHYGQKQEATFTGEGHVVTADGRSFEFQVQLQLDQSQQYAQSTSAAASNASGVANAPGVSDATASASSQSPSLAQLLGGDSGNILGNLLGNALGQATGADAPTNGSTAQGGATGSSGLINWDAILKQSKSLIDLLDSLSAPQLASTGSNSPSSVTAANPAPATALQ